MRHVETGLDYCRTMYLVDHLKGCFQIRLVRSPVIPRIPARYMDSHHAGLKYKRKFWGMAVPSSYVRAWPWCLFPVSHFSSRRSVWLVSGVAFPGCDATLIGVRSRSALLFAWSHWEGRFAARHTRGLEFQLECSN